jgi:hypothetical protein
MVRSSRGASALGAVRSRKLDEPYKLLDEPYKFDGNRLCAVFSFERQLVEFVSVRSLKNVERQRLRSSWSCENGWVNSLLNAYLYNNHDHNITIITTIQNHMYST